MRFGLALAFLLCAACAPVQYAQPATEPADLALTHVNVIDVEGGRILPEQTVLIAGSRVRAVGPSASARTSAGAQVVDARGKYLIPGLWDMHTHFTAQREHLLAFAAHGVTGVRDMGSIVARMHADTLAWASYEQAVDTILAARERIRRGADIGPRIVASGVMLSGHISSLPRQLPHQLRIETAEDGRHAVAWQDERGVDFIKVHLMPPRAAYFGVLEEAKRRGLPVAGHLPNGMEPEEISRAGQRTHEHFNGLRGHAVRGIEPGDTAARARRLAEIFATYRDDGIWGVPTLVSWAGHADVARIYTDPASEPHLRLLAPEVWAFWRAFVPPENAQSEAEAARGLLVDYTDIAGRAYRAKVPLLAGSDFGGLGVYPGVSLHQELVLLNRAGLSPLEALRTATLNPARYLGATDSLGTVAPGKVADLVLLSANPLEDIANTQRIEAVVLNGRYLDRRRLDELLTEAERAANAPPSK